MIVSFSSIPSLFNLVLIGIKQIISLSPIEEDKRFKSKASKIKLVLDAILDNSEQIFQSIATYKQNNITVDELCNFVRHKSGIIEELIKTLYEKELYPVIELFPQMIKRRIQGEINSESQRVIRLVMVINNLSEPEENLSTINEYVNQGKIIVEEMKNISLEYFKFINQPVEHDNSQD